MARKSPNAFPPEWVPADNGVEFNTVRTIAVTVTKEHGARRTLSFGPKNSPSHSITLSAVAANHLSNLLRTKP